jgi:hypothetical protein
MACNVFTNKVVQIALPSLGEDPLNDQCGLHYISINSNRNYLVTGGTSAAQICLLTLPDFTVSAILEGHIDWVFAAGKYITSEQSEDFLLCRVYAR